MIVIVDYGMGNVGSVKNAFNFLGQEVIISNKSEDIEKCSAFPEFWSNFYFLAF